MGQLGQLDQRDQLGCLNIPGRRVMSGRDGSEGGRLEQLLGADATKLGRESYGQWTARFWLHRCIGPKQLRRPTARDASEAAEGLIRFHDGDFCEW